jgi:hypothetical protein
VALLMIFLIANIWYPGALLEENLSILHRTFLDSSAQTIDWL